MTDNHLSTSPTSLVANELGYPIFSYEEALTALKDGQLTFDLGISMLYWRKLRDEFISVPNQGVINFHPAPLPEYKGTGGYNLAILEGLDHWAVSAHYIDSNIDTGDIIEVREFSIDPENETVVSLENRCRDELFFLFKGTIDSICAGQKLNRYPNIGGRYISRKDMEAMKEIRQDDDIDRKIRAFWFPPYDGAYIMIDGHKYTLTNRLILNQLADPTASSLFTADAI
jgi:methionyl-tRNA formyltransferase